MRKSAVQVALSLLLAIFMRQSIGQEISYPTKPVRVVIPFAPGGGTDVLARPLVQKLSESLGQTLIYENRGGGSGIIGAEIVAKAKPDGYTLLLASSGALALNVGYFAKLPYDPVRDFAPITQIAIAPNLLVVNPSVSATTVQQLIAYAKANPGKLNWAGSGGGAASLTMEFFRMAAGISIVQIPYKGAGPAAAALLAGDAQLMFANAGVLIPHLKTGKMRALGVSSLKRLPVLPDVRTIDESGLKGFEGSSWYGLVAPAGTPGAIVGRLSSATAKILKSAEFEKRYSALGAIPVGNTPEQFGEVIKLEIKKWVDVIRNAGIKPL